MESEAVTDWPEQLTNAVPKRKKEFLAGRLCAQRLLATYDEHEIVGIADDRSPIWPPYFVGSITHNRQLAWAVIGKTSDVGSIGIDVETTMSDSRAEEICSLILAERDQGQFLKGKSFGWHVTLLFSAKEAAYKMLFPMGIKNASFKNLELESIHEKQAILNFCEMDVQIAVDYAFDEINVYTLTRVAPDFVVKLHDH